MKIFPKILFFIIFILLFGEPGLAKSDEILSSKSILELQSKATKAYQQGDYQTSITIWLNLLEKQKLSSNIKGQINCHIAATYQKIGHPVNAITYWQEAINIYQDSEEPESLRLLTKILLDKAQSHNILSQTQYSKTLLEQAVSVASREKFTELMAIAYQALGNNYLIEGKLESAISNYSQSFTAAEKLNNNELIVIALSNLSNSHHLQYLQLSHQTNFAQESGSFDHKELLHQSSLVAKKALYNANQAVIRIENNETLYSVEANLHLLKLLKIYTKAKLIKNSLNKKDIKEINKRILLLPNSARKAQALIELAKFQQKDITNLKQALEVAEKIGDLKTQSLALGYLGNIYEKSQNYEQALKLTYQAQRLATQTRANDILYRWEWQRGRILSKIDQDKDAQIAYQQAINSLQLISNQIASTKNFKSQIDFKLEVEPVYRELIMLLLKNNTNLKLKQALEVKQLLQLSELENFFGEDCIITKEIVPSKDSASNSTTKIHTVILNQNTYLILELPKGKLKKFLLPIRSYKLSKIIEQWRHDLENQANERYLLLSEKLYQLIIETIEPELTATNTQKLIFINDGILRNVPMAALYDGKKFLIEKYNVSNSLGFNLQLNQSPASKVNILAFGLALETSNLPALPHVNEEITKMATNYNSKSFLNEEFNLKNFRQQTEKNKYSVIHIATHGKFTGTAEQTYLQAYQQKINLKEFEQILNQRQIDNKIDLLTLTACDTAVGNNRAVLGIAGVAIRSNIDSVLGTLWSISDTEIVNLISSFYHYWLNENYSKSEALRLAQIDMIENPNFHPAIWSSLILIEN